MGANQKQDDFHKVWNAEKVAECARMIEEYGECPGGNPFRESDPNWREADIIYEYSEMELVEIAKCASDIVYFANNYCVAMTDDGVKRITLRPYQEKMLRSYQHNRFNVTLSSRQIGKCFHRQTLIKIKNDSAVQELPFFTLYYALIKKTRKLTLIEKTKLFLYNFESYLTYGKLYKLSI